MRGPSKAATPGSYLVDTLPMLKYVPAWFPGAGFKKAAAESRKSLDALLHTPYEDLRRHMREGKTPDCAATSLLEAFGNTPEIETAIKKTLATMYIAGADTSVSTLSTFFLAMVLYPDIQAKAQDELDTILDGSRLPDLSDRASMPYITSIMKEALRWKPVVSLNLPRRLTQDDMYRGYRIPEGSLMCSNDWAIMHDESVFPSPSVFNPDRFMKDGALNTEVQDPTTIAFGFGRRICPGRYIAQDMLWISIASVLTIFNISMEMNKDGKKVMPETGSLPGFLRSGYHRRIKISPTYAERGSAIPNRLDALSSLGPTLTLAY
ncbi:hypothetical protein CERSUDRAFT_153831 [Gelatoporia subvermispora B]|uniref:Cytochrome P450 n=1 Tax=Ceriporiopsis subvermispora (strain B) TaxID=914234 RepID=M2PLN3_CERS8|nr:hypothetical protein CERSUDRAFT_153831 [Gelatoporia subvermispora B]